MFVSLLSLWCFPFSFFSTMTMLCVFPFFHDFLSSISKMKSLSFGREKKNQNSGIVTTQMHLDLLLILNYMWGGVNRTRMVTGNTNYKESDVL